MERYDAINSNYWNLLSSPLNENALKRLSYIIRDLDNFLTELEEIREECNDIMNKCLIIG